MHNILYKKCQYCNNYIYINSLPQHFNQCYQYQSYILSKKVKTVNNEQNNSSISKVIQNKSAPAQQILSNTQVLSVINNQSRIIIFDSLTKKSNISIQSNITIDERIIMTKLKHMNDDIHIKYNNKHITLIIMKSYTTKPVFNLQDTSTESRQHTLYGNENNTCEYSDTKLITSINCATSSKNNILIPYNTSQPNITTESLPKSHDETKQPNINNETKQPKKNQMYDRHIMSDEGSAYIEKLFTEYVSNKSVIILGPSFNTKYITHDIINSYDIVISINNILSNGYKTDILYTSFKTELNINLLTHKNNVKFICSTIPVEGNNTLYKTQMQSVGVGILNYINTLMKNDTLNVPLKIYNSNKYHNFESIINTRINTGCATILDILTYPIKKLLICGIDFYQLPSSNPRKKMIYDYKPQLNYIKIISLNDNRIVHDNVLHTILYNNYDLFINEIKLYVNGDKKRKKRNVLKSNDENIIKLLNIDDVYLSFSNKLQYISSLSSTHTLLIITSETNIISLPKKYYISLSNNNEYNKLNISRNYLCNIHINNSKINIEHDFIDIINKCAIQYLDIYKWSIQFLIYIIILFVFPTRHYLIKKEIYEILHNQNEINFILYIMRLIDNV